MRKTFLILAVFGLFAMLLQSADAVPVAESPVDCLCDLATKLICGSDGNDYNECEWSCGLIINEDGLKIEHEGSCKSGSTSGDD